MCRDAVTETVTQPPLWHATGRHIVRHRQLNCATSNARECGRYRRSTGRTVNPEVAGSSPVERATKSVVNFHGKLFRYTRVETGTTKEIRAKLIEQGLVEEVLGHRG
jgi:hypothetical protein